jgi:hypothetical protein
MKYLLLIALALLALWWWRSLVWCTWLCRANGWHSGRCNG